MTSYLEQARRRLETLRATSVSAHNGADHANEINEITPRRNYGDHDVAGVDLRDNEKNEISPALSFVDRRCLVCGARLALGGLWYFCGGECATQWRPGGLMTGAVLAVAGRKLPDGLAELLPAHESALHSALALEDVATAMWHVPCVECGAELPRGYWYRCPSCLAMSRRQRS